MQSLPIVCLDVADLNADAATVDALARLALRLRRCGYRLELRRPSSELLDLIDLTGLADALGTHRPTPRSANSPG
jgi:ABC-type transporter Mla MlaB component